MKIKLIRKTTKWKEKLRQARRNEKDSGDATNYEILSAIMVKILHFKSSKTAKKTLLVAGR